MKAIAKPLPHLLGEEQAIGEIRYGLVLKSLFTFKTWLELHSLPFPTSMKKYMLNPFWILKTWHAFRITASLQLTSIVLSWMAPVFSHSFSAVDLFVSICFTLPVSPSLLYILGTWPRLSLLSSLLEKNLGPLAKILLFWKLVRSRVFKIHRWHDLLKGIKFPITYQLSTASRLCFEKSSHSLNE